MSTVLKIGEQTFVAEEIISLLQKYQLMPQLAREIIIDSAINNIVCSLEEQAKSCEQFYQQQKLHSLQDRQAWLAKKGLSEQQLQEKVTRNWKIAQFQKQTWGHQIESYFLKRKAQLDKAIYSLLRIEDAGMAQELYCRLLEEEASFTELAQQYSQGAEARTGGKVGPVALSNLHPDLGKMLSVSKPGQLCPPSRLNNWYVIVCLEELIPAQLDSAMEQKLLQELWQIWLEEQLKTVCYNPVKEILVNP